MALKIGIVGFRGYSGAEIVRTLENHARVEPWLLEHRQDAPEHPHPKGFQGPPRIPCDASVIRTEGLSLIFLATPPGVSMELAPAMLEAGAKVIDLSGAFRLRTAENYRKWYKQDHTQPKLLAEAVYGLPEFYREHVKQAQLVANPGCYPTAANLAIRPLVLAGAADRKAGIICDAKSGVSGAGRKPTLKTSFCEVAENLSAYSILDHRHVAEVLQHSAVEESEFSFTAHLLPLDRGILETVYLRVPSIGTADELLGIYEEAYQSETFVRLYDPGIVPDLRAVQHTNFCDIGVKFDTESHRAVIVAAIDNLLKGAAGQAVQNMNLMLGFKESEGLL